MYLTQSFHLAENKEITDWMNVAASKGYKFLEMRAVGSAYVMIIMEKVNEKD